ncbi:MAG: hypothetical protein H7096_00475 [Flavobacterium sp.]|nr:hypothetical protein [Pedobacter sp.]
MKKLLILFAISGIMFACNSSNKQSDTQNDTVAAGGNVSAKSQQSSTDTNVNKIGTDPVVPDSTKKNP